MNAVLQPRHIQAADEMAMGGMESVVQYLRATNAEQRVRIEKLQDMLHETQRLAANLGSQVRELKGENATAQPGCQIVNVPFDGSYLVVEAQIEAGDCETFDHTGDSGSIVPIHIFVNGRWLDVDDLRAALDLDGLRDRIAVVLA
jgi:uncharacterized coiled-coil protein SlyX